MIKLEQWFADHMEKARGSIEYWQERAKIEYGELVIAQERIAALEADVRGRDSAINEKFHMIEEAKKRIAFLETLAEDRETHYLAANKRIVELEALLDKANPVIVQDLKACMDLHNRNGVLCALTSCRDCKYAKSAVEQAGDK